MRKIVITLFIIAASLTLCARIAEASEAAPPVFSAQHYGGWVAVSMSTPTSGATIRYTTNGADPTASSSAYIANQPLVLTATTTLKARAFKSGLAASTLTAATYTVYTVTQVVFEPEHSPLDNNPNAGGGLRMFPERLSPTETDFRESVLVTITVFPAAPGIEITLRLFDLDDPSTNTAPADPNGAAGNDNFSDFTNRPTQGVLSSPAVRTDQFGKASVRLTVSKQPGNNFAVAATTDSYYANGLRLRASDGSIIEDSAGAVLPNARAKRTPMLTVWRHVHVEVDRMANVTGNTVTGVVAGVTVDTPRRGFSTIDLGLNLPAPGALRTDGLLNRYEGGTITIAINGSSTAFGVVTNTAAATGNDKVVVRGIVPAAANGQSYQLVDDDAAHGFGDGAAIPFPDTGRLVTCFAPAYILPVFDLPNSTPIVPFVLNTSGNSAGDLLPLYRFDNNINNAEKLATYWLVYVLGAMQGTVNEDGDPFDANGDGRPDESGGVSLGTVDAINGVGAVVFLEGLNEVAGGRRVATNATGTGEQDSVVHQVGHLFGAEHVDGGLMSQTSNVFSAQSISKIRHALHP